MNLEEYRSYCLAKEHVTEEFPFDSDTLVFKVAGKMFALANINDFASVNLKCDPEKALELREKYPAVLPGYHMNKKHWNTILLDGSLPDRLLKIWIDESYFNVVTTLPKREREKFSSL
jgi:predicted DNA-binding protein (MmcQ/YjbR family)